MSSTHRRPPAASARRRDRARVRPVRRRRQDPRRDPRWRARVGRHRRQAGRVRSRERQARAHAASAAGDAGTAFDGKHLYQIAEARIDKIDPASGDVLASIPAPGRGSDSGLAWAEGSLWVGQYRDRKIRPDRSRHRRRSAHHRIEPLRHRRELGRRRAVARHLGGRRERDPPHRSAERRRARAARRCRPAPASAASESDGAGLFYCGGGPSGKVRAVRRPTKRAKR